MRPSKATSDGKRDRTHDPKPTSGWWGDTGRHRAAADDPSSRGGKGALGGPRYKQPTTDRRRSGAGPVVPQGSRRRG